MSAMNCTSRLSGRLLYSLMQAKTLPSSASGCMQLARLPSLTPAQSAFAASSPHFSSQNSNLIHTSTRRDIFKSYSDSSATEEQANKANSSEDKKSSGTEEAAGSDDVISKEEYDKMASEIEELKAKNNDFLDKYRRSIAENDNMRKRLTKQIDDAKIFGIQGFCKDLLDVADVLAKAVEAGKAIEDQPGNKDMIEGLKLTQTQLLQVFGRHGLTQIEPVKGEEKFDPNLHEALFQIPAPTLEPNIVLDVQKIGYSLHGRTIRPALVGVSKK